MKIDKKEILKKEIEKKKKELEHLEIMEKLTERTSAIKSLEEYTVEEKVKEFDRLYKMAEEHLCNVEKNGDTDDDSSHYMFEAVFELLARDHEEFWEYHNSL